jgi:hypothetical protein
MPDAASDDGGCPSEGFCDSRKREKNRRGGNRRADAMFSTPDVENVEKDRQESGIVMLKKELRNHKPLLTSKQQLSA